MKLYEINDTLIEFGLRTLGGLHLESSEIKKYKAQSIILIGPQEPLFWEKFSNSEEYKKKNKENSLDAWSKRVLDCVAKRYGAKVFYPFEGPPFMPFYSWALRTGESFRSPINFLVHKEVGLHVSFRGAFGFKKRIMYNFKNKDSPPCVTCTKPCLSSCPAGALTSINYNKSKCISYISENDKNDCRVGCVVRRVCPVGINRRSVEQSRFHMDKFIR